MDGDAPPSVWRVPRALAREAGPLLEAQFFGIGRDIAHPAGNALLAQGFTRERHPTETGCSRYLRTQPESGDTLLLWGFGLVRIRPGVGALMLVRKEFTVRLTEPEAARTAWNERDLPRIWPTTAAQGAMQRLLLHATLLDLAALEETLLAHTGAAWRARSLAAFPGKPRPTLAPAEFAPAYRRLAALCAP